MTGITTPALVTLGWVFLIFFMRLINMSLATIRILAVIRGLKLISWIMGFFQIYFYLVTINWVLEDITNVGKFLAFCAGYATGSVIGIIIEERFGKGYTDMRIISPGHGSALAETLRKAGYAVTETSGIGISGTVVILVCTINRSKIDNLTAMVNSIDTQAFISCESVRAVRHGYWAL